MANLDAAIQKTLESEGGLSDNPNDSGGKTRFGISKKAYPYEDISALTIERAKELYKRDYWDKVAGDRIISQSVAESIFDFAVNSGISTSISLAQRVVKTTTDGIIGQNTIAAINAMNPEYFLNCFAVLKVKRYISITDSNSKNREFFFGWIKRTVKDL